MHIYINIQVTFYVFVFTIRIFIVRNILGNWLIKITKTKNFAKYLFCWQKNLTKKERNIKKNISIKLQNLSVIIKSYFCNFERKIYTNVNKQREIKIYRNFKIN